MGDSDKLGATRKYDRKEVASNPSGWVTRLVAQVDQFATKVCRFRKKPVLVGDSSAEERRVLRGGGCKVSLAELPPETMALLWEYAGDAVAAGLVDGLARVKKCTEAGRHAMALDAATVATRTHSSVASWHRPNVRGLSLGSSCSTAAA